MSARKRPSGVGSNSRRFAEVKTPDGDTLKVPVAKDVGTFLFLRNVGEPWPKSATALLLDTAVELAEGAFIEVEELAAGAGMGRITGASIIKVVIRVAIDSTGRYTKFAQLKRLVYAEREPSLAELASLSPQDLGVPGV